MMYYAGVSAAMNELGPCAHHIPPTRIHVPTDAPNHTYFAHRPRRPCCTAWDPQLLLYINPRPLVSFLSSHSPIRESLRLPSFFLRSRPPRRPTGRRGRKRATGARPELANVNGESLEDRNKWAVLALYEALNARDVERVQQLLAPDIEWWFHGPPEHQHMMRMLTGADAVDEDTAAFRFKPERVAAFGSTVVAEGTGPDSAAWVHAWTVAPDGIITQVREYFNTSVTVTRVAADSAPKPSLPSSSSAKESAGSTHCNPVWQSRLPERARKSFPGLVLAI
ncbi:hypothetical protein Cni_G10612 [Canna indica]|uniref:Senescence associated gene 20 n=1 Tax=Canna indica TaxID=4628 RepID=A0AAQ3K4I5_9LILI|nr:hypothetical protein Cni_G10612 [Canna indica]